MEKKRNEDLFLKFVNYLVNDTNFCLDDVLRRLKEIKNYEQEESQGRLNEMSGEERENAESLYQENVNVCRFEGHHVRLTTEFIHLFTKEMPELFLHSTIVDQVAVMFNYFLVLLTKEDFGEEDERKIKIDPEVLLLSICESYISLGAHQAFLESMAKDERSFKPQLFTSAIQMLQKKRLLGEEKAVQLERVVMKAAELKKKFSDEEMNFDDIPEEFLDPIMGTLMVKDKNEDCVCLSLFFFSI